MANQENQSAQDAARVRVAMEPKGRFESKRRYGVRLGTAHFEYMDLLRMGITGGRVLENAQDDLARAIGESLKDGNSDADKIGLGYLIVDTITRLNKVDHQA